VGLLSFGEALAGTADPELRFIEDRGHIAIFEHDGSSYDRNTSGDELNAAPRQRLARELIATHGDFYDFIVVFTNFDFESTGIHRFLPECPERRAGDRPARRR
jgi:hypothetical protein